LTNPGFMAIDPAGRIWVADNGHARFQVFAPDGTYVMTVGTFGTGDGQFIFGENGANSGAVGFAADGTVYALDPSQQRVQVFAANGEFLRSWGGFGTGPGKFEKPECLAMLADGTIWVGDDGRRDIQHFDGNGTLLGSIANTPSLNLDAIGGM